VSILVVGSVAYDSVETPFGVRERVLGGSATYFSTCASYFSDVSLVAVVGEDFARQDRRFLEGRGVDLAGLVTEKGETFHWSGRYQGDMNEAETLDTRLNVFETFTPDLPEAYRSISTLFLANIDPELQLQVLDQMEKPAVTACDTMNFWIEGKRDALLELLPRLDILLLNEAEARSLAGETNTVRAARVIRDTLGPRRVVVKRGEFGVLVCGPDGFFGAPAFPLETVIDPTGAGDTFAGGFIGALDRDGTGDEASFRRAVAYGTVMASFTVEDFSLDRLKRLEQTEIDQRFAAYLAGTRI
jgi:sugar/nucleoside kinase (ribokinase family)